jgi:5-formyltetrahydrofolate cyclo-ligase
MDKKQIRHETQLKREQLSPTERIFYAKKATINLITHALFIQSQHIACYMAKGSELNTQPLIEAIWAAKKNCYLPVVHPKKFGMMTFIEYCEHDPLTQDRFGIQEPFFDEKKVKEASHLDLVILPVFAFDEYGHRLGTGGGYYDRTFNFMITPTVSNHQKPYLCGFAYSFQQIKNLPHDPWDVHLHAICTEKSLKIFNYSKRN